MNHKERIDAVMNHQPVDRTPFALVDGGAWVSKHTNLSYRELYHLPDNGASIIVEQMKVFDTDLISGVNGAFTAPLNAFGCPIDIDHPGNPVNTKEYMTDIVEDLKALDKSKICETLLANDYFQCMLSQCENIKKLAGDDKYLIVDIAGPFTNACVMRGTAEYMMDLIRNKEAAAELLDFGTEICVQVLSMLREKGADIAFIAEPCSSGTMISPKMFKSLVIPKLTEVKERTDFKYYICHVCGGSGKRVTPLMEAGFNAFSCDYAVDLDQALIDADGKMVIYGNINPAGSMLFDEPEDVYKEAEERIKTAAGRGYIMAPGCDMVCDAPFDNVMAMPKACKELA